jgi:hypothetical protein
MNARIGEYRMLWQAAVTHANPRLSAITRWGSSTLAIVAGAAVAYINGPRAALAVFWCGASVFLLLDWAWRFMPGAVKLNSPADAKLVPQMRRRLVELSCLVCFIGVAGIATAPYADASGLGAWLFWIVVFVVGTGLATAGHAAGSAIVMSACIASPFISKVPDALTAMLSHPMAVVLALPVYAGVILVAVRAMFPQAGEGHWAMLARRARWTSAAGKPDPLLGRVAGTRARNWYAASLRRASASRDSRRLVLHALGPSHHISEAVAALGLLVLVLLGVGILSSWRVSSDVLPAMGWLFATMLMFIPIAQSVRLGQAPVAHAAEQALVRLTPAVPAGAEAFNFQLGRSLALQVLSAWALSTAAALALAALGGGGREALLRLASLCCMALPVVAVPLRDHASRRHIAMATAATLLLMSVVESVIAGMVVNAFTSIPVLWVAALVSIGFTVVVVLRGLNTVRRAPCAFPAGRID